MGEAKRRKLLGLSPRVSASLNPNKDKDRLSYLLLITKRKLSNYPYLPVATMALGLFLLLVDSTQFNKAS